VVHELTSPCSGGFLLITVAMSAGAWPARDAAAAANLGCLARGLTEAMGDGWRLTVAGG
jgi:hypothetical protein